jgi:hypothetical protein
VADERKSFRGTRSTTENDKHVYGYVHVHVHVCCEGHPIQSKSARDSPRPRRSIVYQAYASAIAEHAAGRAQRLDASPAFKVGRMTWIKPSFLWCMYRSGWSHKDANQERILAIEMTRRGPARACSVRGWARCREIDRRSLSVLLVKVREMMRGRRRRCEKEKGRSEKEKRRKEKEKVEVRFQWDPERDVRLAEAPVPVASAWDCGWDGEAVD